MQAEGYALGERYGVIVLEGGGGGRGGGGGGKERMGGDDVGLWNKNC